MAATEKTSAVCVALAAALLATPASGLSSLNILWSANGSSSIGTGSGVTHSSTIWAEIVLVADTAGISRIQLSLMFDTAKLEYVSGAEFTSVNLPSMGNVFNPLALGVTFDNALGTVSGFDQATLSTGLLSATRTLGSIRFHVVDPWRIDGVDVIGAFVAPGDGAFDSAGAVVPVEFNGAQLTPEPSTALLVVCGLAVAGVAGRYRHRA